METILKSKLLWFFVCLLIAGIDYLSGPLVRFPALYMIPICLSAWYIGFNYSAMLAILFGLLRIIFFPLWQVEESLNSGALNALIRVLVFTTMAWLTAHLAQQKKEIRILKGLLPVCANCKQIRARDGSWQSIETYITSHSEATFTHGVCPECYKTSMAELKTMKASPTSPGQRRDKPSYG